MNQRTRRAWLSMIFVLGPIATLALGNAFGQSDSGSPAASVVSTRTYASLAPVPRGRGFEVAVVAEIARGYHVNSHKPLEQFFIPTTLTMEPAHGLRQGDVIYPEGHLKKLPFAPDKPLSVYTGSVTFLIPLQAEADAPLGPQKISLTLRYQPCNDLACLPPVNLPAAVRLQIAPAGTSAMAVHPEIFAGLSSQPAN